MMPGDTVMHHPASVNEASLNNVRLLGRRAWFYSQPSASWLPRTEREETMRSSHKLKKLHHHWHWLAGLGAFSWLLIRSGVNPRRLNYPCQQAAMPIAINWILAIAAFLGGSILLKRYTKYCGIIAVLGGAVWLAVSVPSFLRSEPSATGALPVWRVDHPISTVFVLDSIPLTTGSLAAGNASVPDEYLSDPAMDTLFEVMESGGLHLWATAAQPDGIVGSDNSVIIKGNYQWNSRNTTNTDRVKGLIWKILNHPDGFTGEIIICDNTQDIGTGFDQNDNNSEDENQSIVDVVNTFAAKGYPVYYYDWYACYWMTVSEYSEGDMSDGYLYDEITKVTYPKFVTPSLSYFISLKYGIWDTTTATYDPARLCIIDFPVLKAHSWAGSTIAVKNWIGVVTTAYAVQRFGDFYDMHDDYFFGPYALVARVMAETYPRLSIVDATWTTRKGPIDLNNVIQTDVILASTDPVAASWYAAKYVLTPVAVYPDQTNPDYLGGLYNINLGYWNSFLRDSAEYACTVDSSEMSIFSRNLITDSDGDEVVDALDNCPALANADQSDTDNDGAGDLCDVCPGYDDFVDTDQDGHADGCDLCPGYDDFADGDDDTVPDSCDNCPDLPNSDQADSDGNGVGDACQAVCGDANGDGLANVGDAVFMIAYIFNGGAPPDPECAGDANGDGNPNVGDAVYLIAYVFNGGPPPVETCCVY
jgi:hypothetical protein